jgi:hypothetical protein
MFRKELLFSDQIMVKVAAVFVKFGLLLKKSPQDRAKLKTGLSLHRSILNSLPIRLF